MKARKQKKCTECKTLFTPFNSMQKVCSIKCAAALAEKQRGRKWRMEAREYREKNKPLSKLKAEAQAAFNAYIRERDYHHPCISCGAMGLIQKWGGVWDAGHYRTIGAAEHMRLVEDNCHKQCVECNRHLSGNHVEYRKRLIDRIGLSRVEAIEHDNTVRKYSRDDLKAIKQLYSRKARELKRAREKGELPTCQLGF